ncbi:Metallo-dependent phosphatase [Periconia macrospinosa]|uniref:Metallo-dependent phosphatase n=1 Tax=Periconia macrospinosa TaxID=97972 RepID=A0A2V1D2L2_9PLEO|nr:Metallo-dependent phosphatase [Periconia macrospinosa]
MAASFRNTWTPASPNGNGKRPETRHHESLSVLKFAWSTFHSLPTRRKTLLVTTFILGVFLTTMLKHESILWLLASTAGTTPMVGWGQGTSFDYPGLRFDIHDRKFQITIFSDLHLGDQARPGTDNKTISVMKDVLDAEPGTDLVVLNGDLISCEYIAPDSANGMIDKVIDPLLKRKMPFSATFGNHDMSKTCDTRAVAKHMREKANAKVKGHRKVTWTENAVAGEYHDVGTSNYYIPIYSAGGGGNPKLKMLLWFFDSKGGNRYQPQGVDVPVTDMVDEKVISWFKLTRDQIRLSNNNIPIPSLAFIHIPPSITEAFRKSGLRTEQTEPGLNDEIISVLADGIPGGDRAFLQALLETDGLMAVFSGHDHRIDWCMKYPSSSSTTSSTHSDAFAAMPHVEGSNLHICFNRHSGYGGYSDFERGGRHVVVDEDVVDRYLASYPPRAPRSLRSFPPARKSKKRKVDVEREKKLELQTWIRLESGGVSGNVSLNATFGTDLYDEVAREKTFFAEGKILDGGGGDGGGNGSMMSVSFEMTATKSVDGLGGRLTTTTMMMGGVASSSLSSSTAAAVSSPSPSANSAPPPRLVWGFAL